MRDWTDCITYQWILAHLAAISQRIFDYDMHIGNIIVEQDKFFTLREGVTCGLLRVIDLGMVQRVANPADAISQALFSCNGDAFGMYDLWNRFEESSGDLFVGPKVVELLQEIMALDGRLQETISSLFRGNIVFSLEGALRPDMFIRFLRSL